MNIIPVNMFETLYHMYIFVPGDSFTQYMGNNVFNYILTKTKAES